MLNLDEAYKFLKMLNLVSMEKGSDLKHSGEAAPEFNRVMQTGQCSIICKGSGSSVGTDRHGGTVSLLGFGNCRFSKLAPCLIVIIPYNPVMNQPVFFVCTGFLEQPVISHKLLA